MKKSYYIIIGIIVIILISILLFFIFRTKTPPVAQEEIDITEIISDTTILKIKKTLGDRVYFPFINSINNEMTYLGEKGIYFFRYNLVNQHKQKITDQEILGPLQLFYSSSANEVIVMSNYPDTNLKYYNLSTKQNSLVNSNITNISWGKKNPSRIFYIYLDKKNHNYTLNISDPNGDKWEKLLDLGESSASFFLDNYENNIFYTDFVNVYKFNLENKQTEEIINANLTENIIFSPNGKKIAYNSYNHQTRIYDLDTQKTTNLSGIIDLKKTIFSNENEIIYLKDLNQLIKMDIKNNKAQAINLDNSDLNSTNVLNDSISNLSLSLDNKLLYFTSKDILYKIDL